jgi:hypothetical protein
VAPSITGIHVENDGVVDRQNSILISADVADSDMAVVEINGRVLQMERGPASSTGYIYRRRIHAVEVGQFTGNGYVVAYKKSSDESANDTFSITISELDPIQPEEFYKALLEANLDHTSLRDIQIDIEDTKARVDKQDGVGIVIQPGSRLRENVSKHQYKNVWYPLNLIIYSSESRKECQRLMEAVLAVEENFLNVSGNDVYDMIKIMDDGKLLPSWNTYAFKHTIQLRKYLQKVQVTGY